MNARSLIAVATLALSACGGGGSGSDGSNATPPPASGVLSLTTSNYTVATQEALSSADYVTRSTEMLTGAQVASDRIVLDAVLAQLQRTGGWFSRAPRLATGVTTVQVEPCSGGGNITITLNDVNGNDEPDAGDSARAVATNCIEVGVTINGALNIAITAATGTSSSSVFSIAATVTLENFRATSPAISASGNGQISVAMSSTGVNRNSFTLSVTSLTIASTVGSTSSTRSLSNFTINIVTTPSGSGSSSSGSINGTLSSTGLGSNSITMATPSPFIKLSTAAYPSSGQMIITGAANSRVRVTALSSTTVQMELDADGNGSYETSTNMLWSQLI